MNIDAAIARTLQFIQTQQTINGAFTTVPCAGTHSPASRETTFATALILGCLSDVNGINAEYSIKHALNFLLSEKSDSWSWNYWRRNNKKSKTLPDDLDDTACSLIALSIHEPALIDESVMSALTKHLIHAELQPGGPYRSWLVTDYSDLNWNDVDPVVNANIGYLLKLHDIRLPGLEAYCEKIIHEGTYTSKYYPFLSVAYFLSRYYKGAASEKLKQAISSKRQADGSWGNMLNTALAVSSLLRLGVVVAELTTSITKLIQIALRDEWQTNPLYIEEISSEAQYCGATAVTAAYGYEALSLWKQLKQPVRKNNHTLSQKHTVNQLHNVIIARFNTRFAMMTNLVSDFKPLLAQVLRADVERSITLLPYYFFTTVADTELTIQIGYVNLCGWLAYTIYDDIMDEASHIELLPMANACLREVVLLYEKLFPQAALVLFHDIMDSMETANAWEQRNCRFTESISLLDIPDYANLSVLANKSLAHACGPIALLLNSGYSISDTAITNTLTFFHHYLIARQLNDDAHDWLKDLNNGFCNYVATLVLQHFFKSSKQLEFSLKTDCETVQKIFLNEIITSAATEILIHCQSARRILQALPKQSNKAYLVALLVPLERAAQEAVNETVRAQKFIALFSK